MEIIQTMGSLSGIQRFLLGLALTAVLYELPILTWMRRRGLL